MELPIKEAKVCEVEMPLFKLTDYNGFWFEYLEQIVGQAVPVFSDNTLRTQIGFANVDFSPDPNNDWITAVGVIDYHTPDRLDIEIVGKYAHCLLFAKSNADEHIIQFPLNTRPSVVITGVKVKYIWLSGIPAAHDSKPITLKLS